MIYTDSIYHFDIIANYFISAISLLSEFCCILVQYTKVDTKDPNHQTPKIVHGHSAHIEITKADVAIHEIPISPQNITHKICAFIDRLI